jgi:hypothetical protein
LSIWPSVSLESILAGLKVYMINPYFVSIKLSQAQDGKKLFLNDE